MVEVAAFKMWPEAQRKPAQKEWRFLICPVRVRTAGLSQTLPISLRNRDDPARGAARVGLKISSPCDGPWSSRFDLFAPRSAQALSSEFDAMGVVNEAVEDGVGVSGVADHVMPCGQGKPRVTIVDR